MMKILFNALFTCFLFLTACSVTTEEKIMRGLKSDEFFKMNITSANITDTIYERDVLDTLLVGYSMIDTLEAKIKKCVKEKKSFEEIRKLEDLKGFYERRAWRLQLINFGDSDSTVCGYYVLITSKTDTLEVLLKNDLKMLGPRFMFEYDERPRKIRTHEGAIRTETQRPRTPYWNVVGKSR
jgi:hypothetical protein